MNENRRADPRFRISQMVRCGNHKDIDLWAAAKELSRSGFSAEATFRVEPGSIISAILELPYGFGMRSVRVRGRVAHSHMVEDVCEFGVRISEFGEDDRRAWEDYVEGLEAQA